MEVICMKQRFNEKSGCAEEGRVIFTVLGKRSRVAGQAAAPHRASNWSLVPGMSPPSKPGIWLQARLPVCRGSAAIAIVWRTRGVGQ